MRDQKATSKNSSKYLCEKLLIIIINKCTNYWKTKPLVVFLEFVIILSTKILQSF